MVLVMILGAHAVCNRGTPLQWRDIILLGICPVIAYWVDQYYYNSKYSTALADELHHIAIGFR